MADPPRYLARDSSQGYVDHESRALRDGRNVEPEPIPEDLQREYSAKARQTFEVLRAEEVERKRTRSRVNRLRQLETEARKKQVDIHRFVSEIERQIGLIQQAVHPA